MEHHLEPIGEQQLVELAQKYEEIARGVFQIVRGGDYSASECPYPSVCMGDRQKTIVQLEAEDRSFSVRKAQFGLI